MRKLIFNLSRSSTTTIIGIMIVLGYLSIAIISLFHKAIEKDINMFVLTGLNNLVSFVAGYYFNKKDTPKPTEEEK